MKRSYKWKPIEDLPKQLKTQTDPNLKYLAETWKEQADNFDQDTLREFTERLSREWAVETGQIEGLYRLDKGLTETLIEKGLESIDIPYESGRTPLKTSRLIVSHKNAIDGLFSFVKREEPLSNHYIRSLHSELTKEQDFCEAVDSSGKYVHVPLLKGKFKELPNNPSSADCFRHEYCPPEHVQSEMDQLIAWHLEHQKLEVSPEIESAWLHHRFVQIHPFQDGNGRLARTLATLIFIRAGWFPLIVKSEKRSSYIDALEMGDQGDLIPLIRFFTEIAVETFSQAFDLKKQLSGVPAALEDLQSRLSANHLNISKPDAQLELVGKLMKITEDELSILKEKLQKMFSSQDFVEIDVTVSKPEPSTCFFPDKILQSLNSNYQPGGRFKPYFNQITISNKSLTRTFLIHVACFALETDPSYTVWGYAEYLPSFSFNYQDKLLSAEPFIIPLGVNAEIASESYSLWLSQILNQALKFWNPADSFFN
jgi:fido (protein-threonine AMPylation protein)